MANKKSLKQQAKEIMKIAEESGLQSNYFFCTTFERYQVQLDTLAELEKTIQSGDLLVSKEYVKGRENIYIHPAIKAYNSTVDSANKTVATLMRILKNFNVDTDDPEEETDPLMKMINGGGASE